MEPVHIVAVAVAASGVVAAIVVLLLRRAAPSVAPDEARLRQLEADLLAARDTKAEAERRLAVEQQKASRLPELERQIAEDRTATASLQEAKAAAERNLATASAGLVNCREARAKAETRVVELEANTKLATARCDALRDDKAGLEEALAAKTETVSQTEAAAADLRQRLAATEKAREELQFRLDAMKEAKAQAEKLAAETAAFLAEKIQAAAQLQSGLEQAQAVAEKHRQEAAELRIKHSTLQETLDQVTKQAEEKLELMRDAKERMTQEFKVLADEVMKKHGQAFAQQNKEQIDGVLTPLREKLAV